MITLAFKISGIYSISENNALLCFVVIYFGENEKFTHDQESACSSESRKRNRMSRDLPTQFRNFCHIYPGNSKQGEEIILLN